MEMKNQNDYFDYAGNQINVGMKILLISIKSFAHTLSGSSDNSIPMHFPERSERRVILEYNIVLNDMFPDVLYARATGLDISIDTPLKFIIKELNENQIIAIKGFSDEL